MPLIDLKTNLKDLRFGHDRYDGGSSNEPFIQTRVPATNEPLQTGALSLSADGLSESLDDIILGAGVGAAGGAIIGGGIGAIAGTVVGAAAAAIGSGVDINAQLQLPTAGTGGPDFLLRGGLLLPNIIIKDTIRLAKYFTSTEGILFTIKQNLLSRSGVKTQGSPSLLNEGIYTPFSTLTSVIGNSFGLHPNKQGLNPLLGLASGDGYVPNRYFEAIKDNLIEYFTDPKESEKGNRLYGLYSVKLLGNDTKGRDGRGYRRNDIAGPNDIGILLSYGGGPNSILGTIGRTRIKYATSNTDAPLSVLNAKSELGYFDTTNLNYNNYATLNYKQLEEISKINKEHISPKIIDFRKDIRESLISKGLSSNSPDYTLKKIDSRIKLGDPGSLNRDIQSYTKGDPNIGIYSKKSKNENGVFQPGGGQGAAGINSFDVINTSNVGILPGPNDPLLYDDLVTFKIEVIPSNTPSSRRPQIWFRAYLDQISDSYSSNWDATKYIGRPESFYTYSGFDRKISLGWTVAAQSKLELLQMYRRLNYLASICAPDYSSNGYMRGNIITLTIGGYIFEQPGILTGFSYEMNEENDTWEIAIDDEGNEDTSAKQLPHIIRVKGFNFIPIHQFVPELQYINDQNDDGIRTYGYQRYISLANRTGDNWDMSQYPSLPPPPLPSTP